MPNMNSRSPRMDDKVLDRFSVARKTEPHIVSVTAQDDAESLDLGYFGVLRGTAERSVMLELRQRDGNILAIGYAWLERVEFDPSHGIKLHAAGQEITIAGRNLNKEVRPNVRLFESLVRHRVPWLREADHGELMQSPESATVIEAIAWQSAKK
jgi:hypothetical protein